MYYKPVKTGDWTTDPWITRPVLYPYTTGTHSPDAYLAPSYLIATVLKGEEKGPKQLFLIFFHKTKKNLICPFPKFHLHL